MKKKCSTCLHYQPSPVGGQGWCRNPILRKPHERTLVGANELACDKKFYDFWQPIRSSVREVRGAASNGPSSVDVGEVLGVRDVSQYLVYLGVLVVVIGLLSVNVLLAARPSQASADQPAAKPTAVATAPSNTSSAASSSTPAPTPIPPTPTPFQTYRVVIANTNREGLVIRADPGGDRLTALPEGAELTVIGPDRQVDGRVWKNVRDQRGNTGWVPEEFTQRR